MRISEWSADGCASDRGPEGAEGLVVQRYAELARWFAPLDLHVRELDLSARYAWKATLSNGMVLDLGRDPGADAPDPHGLPGALPFGARLDRKSDGEGRVSRCV